MNDFFDRIIKATNDPKVLYLLDKWITTFEKYFSHFTGIYYSEKLLNLAVDKYLSDTNHLNFYPLFTIPNKFLLASLATLAITNSKPIQIDSNANIQPNHFVINEIFALQVGLLQIDMTYSNIPKPLIKNTIYLLKFKNLDTEALALILQSLETISKLA